MSKAKMVFRTCAVIVDMDGVITNTMPDHFRAWKTILKDEGIHVTHLDVYRREGQRGITSLRELFREYHHPLDRKRIKGLLLKKEELFKKIVRQRFISGSRTFLKSLRRKGFALALVTGTSRHELHMVLPYEIYNLFTVVVTGNDVKKGKPDPQPYLLALKKLELKARDAVVIENAPFGIASAKAAGLTCLALATSLPAEYLKKASRVFDSIKDLRENVIFQHPNVS